MLRGHQTQQGRPQREALAGICGQNIPREASAKQGRPPRPTICAFTQGPVPKRVPLLRFMIHCCHLKCLNHIWTRNPLFSSWTRPSKLRSQSWAEAKVLKHCLPPSLSFTHFPLSGRFSSVGETLNCCQGACLWQAGPLDISNNLESGKAMGGLGSKCLRGCYTPVERGFPF